MFLSLHRTCLGLPCWCLKGQPYVMTVLSTCASVRFAGGCCPYVFQQWYTATMNLLGTWLTERMDQQLHVYQLKILIRITKVKADGSLRDLKTNTQKKPPHNSLSTHTLMLTYRCPPRRKSTGTSACRASSTPPSTARCTTRCATG